MFSAQYPNDPKDGSETVPLLGGGLDDGVYQPGAPFNDGNSDMKRARQKRRRRAAHFVVLALLSVWALHHFCSPLFRGLFDLVRIQLPGINTIGKFPSDVEIGDCVPWKELHTSTTATIFLDGDSDLFFAGVGRLSSGIFNVDKHEQTTGNGKVNVTVSGKLEKGDLEKVRVCKITRGSSIGVGVFSPRFASAKGGSLDISVQLPARKGAHDVALETYLPHYGHHFEHLAGIAFGKLTIPASRGFVKAEFVEAETIDVKTNGAIIQGKYKATSSATFSNTIGQIQVDLELEDLESTPGFTTAKVTTTSGRIDLYTRLTGQDVSDDSQQSGATFVVDASSIRGEVNSFIHEQPLNSRLFLTAKTIFRKINIGIPPAFQGSYSIRNPFSAARATFDPNVQDPSGQNRTRRRDGYRDNGWESSGAVWWSDNRKDSGSVDVRSFMASVIDLYFTR